jgi:hypothetical protein
VLINQEDVHIKISFEDGKHEDNMPFGESMNVVSVAHAFPPSRNGLRLHALEGAIHLDDRRGWTVDTPDGINFLQIVCHELGHAFGLEHSMIQNAVMHPFVRISYDSEFKLDKGAQFILFLSSFSKNLLLHYFRNFPKII